MKLKNLMPLFMVLFIDSMGMGILFPILAVAFMNPSSHFLAANISHNQLKMDYGIVVSVFMICWFFGAALLGEYSDIKGRKKSLVICLLGAALGYILSAFALSYHSLSLLIIGRVIAGFTAGSQTIAQAAIADSSNKETLSKNMGYMILMTCLGFVAGPILGALFSNTHINQSFNLATPMWIAAALSIINMLLLWLLFKETYTAPKEDKSFNLGAALILFMSAFKNESIRGLCIIYMLFVFAWSNYYGFISIYLVDKFHYNANLTTLFNAFMALGFCLGSGFLNARLSNILPNKIISIGLIVASITCFITLQTTNQILIWACSFILGTAVSILFTQIITLFSLQVSDDKQGWVMGVSGSIMAISFGLTTLASGALSILYLSLPLWLTIAGFLCCLLAIKTIELRNTKGK